MLQSDLQLVDPIGLCTQKDQPLQGCDSTAMPTPRGPQPPTLGMLPAAQRKQLIAKINHVLGHALARRERGDQGHARKDRHTPCAVS